MERDMGTEMEEFASATMAEIAEPATEVTETTTAEPAEVVETEAETPAELETEPEGATAAPETTTETIETQKEEKSVPLAALLDERDKRQAHEAKVKELQAKLEEQTKTAPAPLPDVLDDQEGFVNGVKAQLATMGLQLRTEMSQELMRMSHEDYDTREAEFTVMATENPQLARDLAASPNPAKYAYDTAVKAEKLSKMDNVEEYEATLRAEIEAKVRAELTAEITGEQADIATKAGSLTPSLAGTRAAGGNKTLPAEIRDPLETTFKR
jgi:hypothetical protein